MKELIEEWRKDAEERIGRSPSGEFAYHWLTKCADELEAAMKPKPIESAPLHEEVLAKHKKYGWLEVIKDYVQDQETPGVCWGNAWIPEWLHESDFIGWLPLSSVGGEE